MMATSQAMSAAIMIPLGWTLLHSLWQFALIALLLWSVLTLLHRKSARMRYLVACAGLLVMVGSSVATFARMRAPEPLSANAAAAALPAVNDANSATDTSLPSSRRHLPHSSLDWTPDEIAAASTINPSSVPASGSVLSGSRETIARWISIAWLMGVSVLSLRNLGGWLGVHRLRRTGTTPASAPWLSTASSLRERMRIRQTVHLLQSSAVSVPVVIGWLKPVLLLPASLVGEMSPAQVEAILAHELAHIRRHDYLVNFVQMVIETFLFYHPAVWWTSRQIRVEREHCCDDAATEACGSAVGLSEALTLLAASKLGYKVALAASGSSPGSALLRVQRLLLPSAEPLGAPKGVSAVLVMLLVSLGMTAAWSRLATAENSLASAVAHAQDGGLAQDEESPEGAAVPLAAEKVDDVAPASSSATSDLAVAPAVTSDPATTTLPPTPASEGAFVPKALGVPASEPKVKMAIFVMRPDGTDVRQIAVAPGHDHVETPRWSHDGKRILFTASRGELGGRDFYVVNADGSDLMRLGAHGHADWSPDDKKVVFDVYNGTRRPDDGLQPLGEARGSYVRSLAGPGDARITSGLCPRWSPDGSKVAVTDHKTLRVVDLATGTEKDLFENPFEYIFAGFNWSPDGKWLVLSAKTSPMSKRQMLLVSANGEKDGLKLLQTSEQGGSISFSPDGKQLVFADDLQLRLMDSGGEGGSRLVPNQINPGRDPHWSPDGKWIVYAGHLPSPSEPTVAPAP